MHIIQHGDESGGTRETEFVAGVKKNNFVPVVIIVVVFVADFVHQFRCID